MSDNAPTASNAGRVPVRNPVVVLREEFDDWSVIYNPDTAEAAGINSIGVAIWKLVDGRRSIAAIVEAVRNAFDEVPEAAPAEVEAFIGRLAANGFIGYAEGEAVE